LLFLSEILIEDSINSSETLKREQRKVASMSWIGSDDIDIPPSKPSRVMHDSGI